MRKADLHMHTRASHDSILEAEQAFRLAREHGLAALSFTEHESVASVEEGRRLSSVYDVAFLPGVEVSSSWHGESVHVLGYFLDGPGRSLRAFVHDRVWPGTRRTALVRLEGLRRRGVPVTVAEYDAEAETFGRSGLALYRLLLRKGLAVDMKDYLARLGPELIAVESFYPPVPEVVGAIHKAGGMAVLAHPAGSTEYHHFLADEIAGLASEGLDGVEVWHPVHTPEEVAYYREAADRLGLLKTGGSDSHGNPKVPERMVGGTFCDFDEVLLYLQPRGRS